MQWIQKKRNRRKNVVFALGMASVLLCDALNPVFASEEWLHEAVVLDEEEEMELLPVEIEDIEDIEDEVVPVDTEFIDDEENAEDEIFIDQNENAESEEEEWILGDTEAEFPEESQIIMEEAELAMAQNMQAGIAVLSTVTAPDLIGTIGKKNQWQIVAEEYTGRELSNKKGYDIDKDGSDDIFYQKNVISTDIENEFRVYMSVTKKMTWDELLAEANFGVTTSRRYKTEGELVPTDDIKGNDSVIIPGKGTGTAKDRNYKATVTFTRKGKTVHSYTGWYHGETPNCENATGFIFLENLNQCLVASCGVSLQNDTNGGGTLHYTVDLDAMASQNIYFSVEDIVVDSVEDTMGEYVTYEGVENGDGTCTFDADKKMLNWIPISNGVTGVQVTENGGLTGYHYNIHQLVYKAYLNVEKDGFRSCAQNMKSTVKDSESFRVNQQAILNCHISDSKGKAEMQVPYVRGLLYDLEFQKIVQDSSIVLEGVTFAVAREKEGNSYAEQLSYTAQQVTGKDGWIKFHNMPWGRYTITEISYQEGNEFQKNYLTQNLPMTLSTVSVGKIINGNALTAEHQGRHSCDLAEDMNNSLFIYNNGIVENTPYRATITIKKNVSEYSSLSDELQNKVYTMQMNSIDLLLKPEKNAGNTLCLKEDAELKHLETVTYELLVPQNGGKLELEEIIPADLENKIIFEGVEITENMGSTTAGICTEKEQGCSITVMPGNDITITVMNVPIGKIYIKKEISNYQSALAQDEFVIQAVSAEDGGVAVNTQVVLKHGQSSAAILIKKTTAVNLTEILPKEYSLSKISVSGGGTLQENQITVRPGEEVTVTICNTFEGQTYFHASDAIKNIFS